jgi:uncharacterized phage-associated protein
MFLSTAFYRVGLCFGMQCAWFAMFDARSVVLYLIARYRRVVGKGITRTRLMKLLFLVDYIHWKRCGRKLTNLEWRTYLFGPFSREVLDILDELEDGGKVIVEEIEKGVYLYKAYEEPTNLSEAVKSLVNEVVEKFGKLSLDELLNYVYSLNEVKRTGIGEVIL